MNCEDARIYLAAYLDDELDVPHNIEMQKHLAGCAACREAREEYLALRSSLAGSGLYAAPSADFARRVKTAVRRAAKEEARAARSLWFPSLHWISAAVALVLGVGIAAFLVIRSERASHQQFIASAVLAGHIRSLQGDHLIDVPSSDRHTVKPWFQGKLDFSPPVPDLSAKGWTLTGGRLDYIDGRPAAALVYRRGKHNINAFVWPAPNSAGDAIQAEEAQGYHILHWNRAGMTYWIISDLNSAELLQLAQALRE